MLVSSCQRLARIDPNVLLHQELRALLLTHKPRKVKSSSLLCPAPHRREPYPRSTIVAAVPEGWEASAKTWVDTHIVPFRHQPNPLEGEEMASRLQYELFYKCLLSPAFVSHIVSSSSNEKTASSLKEQLSLPAAVSPLGMETLQLTARALGWYSGDVPSGSSLKGLLPQSRLVQLHDDWNLSNILMHAHGKSQASSSEIVTCAVAIVGSLALTEGVDVASAFVVEKVFPTVHKMEPSAPPIVF